MTDLLLTTGCIAVMGGMIWLAWRGVKLNEEWRSLRYGVARDRGDVDDIS